MRVLFVRQCDRQPHFGSHKSHSPPFLRQVTGHCGSMQAIILLYDTERLRFRLSNDRSNLGRSVRTWDGRWPLPLLGEGAGLCSAGSRVVGQWM